MASRAWLRMVGAAAVLVVLVCVSVPADPQFRLCPFHWLTGRPCPLCGLTRGLFALAKGHWSAAIHFNALTPLALVMILSLFWNRPWRGRLWAVGMVAFAVYGICRAALA